VRPDGTIGTAAGLQALAGRNLGGAHKNAEDLAGSPRPSAIAVGPDGALYVLDLLRDVVERIGPARSASHPAGETRTNRAILAWRRGDADAAEAMLERAFDLSRTAGCAEAGVATTLRNLGMLARSRGQYERAAALPRSRCRGAGSATRLAVRRLRVRPRRVPSRTNDLSAGRRFAGREPPAPGAGADP
jgi:hypothetical protein